MNLYFVFAYSHSGNFNPIRIVSELSWENVSNKYIDNHLKLKRKEVMTWVLIDERPIDSIKYEELSLLDGIIMVDKDGRVDDASDFRKEFLIRKLAGF